MTRAEIEKMKEIRNGYTKTLDKMKQERKKLILDRKMQRDAIEAAEKERINDFRKLIKTIPAESPKTAHEISLMTNGDFSSRSIAGYGVWATYRANPEGHNSRYKWSWATFPNFRSEVRTSERHMVEVDENGHIIPGSDEIIIQKKRVYYTVK